MTGENGLDVSAYNTIITGGKVPLGNQNIIDRKGSPLFIYGQNETKTGTIKFNNPQIKNLLITGNGIQGTINIYTSQ